MPLSAGARLGPYEILSALGAGGMGEVYRARDTKLDRDVAIKVLPELFVADPERVARFQREAKTLAALNHPHIGGIYGLEDADGVRALVLELVEGPTLADRIAQGPIPLDETLPIARQIAEALEAAHEAGIIHRDLKPANIKLRPDGTVKVLDFGLAKALEPMSAASPNVTASPTITTPAMMTGIGMILGTAAYMSPEQAKGRPADKRSDVWAFGAVLYETLTGRRAFEGGDVSDTLAAVLRAEPEWSALPIDVPPTIRALMQGCLKKDRRERIGDISTALYLLKEPLSGLQPLAAGIAPRHQGWKFAVSLGATAVVFGLVGSLTGWWARQPLPQPITRLSIALADGQRFPTASRAIAFSPDGTRIAYVSGGVTANQHTVVGQVYVRPLAALESRPLGPPVPISAGPLGQPFFSPDGQWIGFYSSGDRTLKKISVNGGTGLTICKAESQPSGVTWGRNGIVFVQPGIGIMRVTEDGGEPETLVRLNPSEAAVGPQVIDRGRSLLFTLATETGPDRWDKAAVVVQSLQSGQRTVVMRGGTDARHVHGHLVYAVGNNLWAVGFDEATGRTVGNAVPILEGVSRTSTGGQSTGQARFDISSSGTLVYVQGGSLEPNNNRQLARADRSGNETVLPLPPQPYLHPRISPKGKELAFATDDGRDAIIWVIDDLSSVSRPRRLTFQGRNLYPIWTPDGRYLTFQSDREGDAGLFLQRADGTPPVERLTKAEPQAAHTPNSWSPDGKILAFSVASPGNAWSVWTISMEGDRQPKPFSDTKSLRGNNAAFSPDGRWLAYTATLTLSGAPNLFLQPFPPTGAKYQLSMNAGTGAAWSPDGKQIFYETGPGAPNRLIKIDVQLSPSFLVGSPTAIEFRRPFPQNVTYRAYDISPDAKQFVLVVTDDAGSTQQRPTHINVVVNWMEELQQRVPAR